MHVVLNQQVRYRKKYKKRKLHQRTCLCLLCFTQCIKLQSNCKHRYKWSIFLACLLFQLRQLQLIKRKELIGERTDWENQGSLLGEAASLFLQSRRLNFLDQLTSPFDKFIPVIVTKGTDCLFGYNLYFFVCFFFLYSLGEEERQKVYLFGYFAAAKITYCIIHPIFCLVSGLFLLFCFILVYNSWNINTNFILKEKKTLGMFIKKKVCLTNIFQKFGLETLFPIYVTQF